MTNDVCKCPVGAKINLAIWKGIIPLVSTEIKIGTEEGLHSIKVSGKKSNEITARFTIHFIFPTEEAFIRKKCCLEGNASFIGTAEIKKEKTTDIVKVNQGFSFDTCKKKAGRKCCSEKFEKEYSDTFRNKKLKVLGIKEIIINGKMTVNVESWQKKGKYLGNKNPGHMEIHDLKKIEDGCKIDEILEEHKVYFDSVKEGLDEGFNGCFYCLPKYHTE